MNSEEKQLQAVSVISAVLYGVMFAISFFRLLDQFTTRPFGLHKLFHIFTSIIYAFRFLSWTSVSFGMLLVISPFDLFLQDFAYLFYFGTLAVVSIHLLEKLAFSFTEKRRKLVFTTCWVVFCGLSIAVLILFVAFPEVRAPQIVAQEPPWMDVAFVIHSVVGCCMFIIVSVSIKGWRKALSKRSKLKSHIPHLRAITAMMIIVIIILIFQMVASVWSMLLKMQGYLMNPFLKMAAIHWLPEAVPVGIIFLIIMRDHDTLVYAPMIIGFNDDPYDSHVVPESNSSEDVSAFQPPRAPSAVEEAEEPKQVSSCEYRTIMVSPNTPARVIVVVSRRPELPLNKCASEISQFHDVPAINEIDRTELLENEPGSDSQIPFTKTLLIRDSELMNDSLPIIAAYSLVDPSNPVCLGCQRLSVDNLVGSPIVLEDPVIVFGLERKTRKKRAPSVKPGDTDINTRLLDAEDDSVIHQYDDDDDAAGSPVTELSDMSRMKYTSESSIGSYPILQQDGLTLVLEKQGVIPIHPRSLCVGCCIRTFRMFGQIGGPSVRIGVKQDFWQSENAFDLPRQMLQQLIDFRKAQLVEAQKEADKLTADDDDEDQPVTARLVEAGLVNSDLGGKAKKKQKLSDKVKYSDVLHTMQDITTTTELERQFCAVVSCFAEHISAMERAIEAYSPENLMWSFKPSVMKLSKEMRFVPTNLHTEMMSVTTTKKISPDVAVLPVATYAFVTLGVPSAFVYKGLRTGARDLRERVKYLRDKEHPSALFSRVKKLAHLSAKGVQGLILDNGDESKEAAEMGAARLSNVVSQALLERKSVELLYIMRRDITRGQVFSAVADAFLAELESKFMNACARAKFDQERDHSSEAQPTTTTATTTTTTTTTTTSTSQPVVLGGRNDLSVFLDQVSACGFLIQFESLLSTRGKERTMIGDYEDAVRMIRAVKLRLVLDSSEAVFARGVKLILSTEGDADSNGEDEYSWIMEFNCSKAVFNQAPKRLQDGGLIDVTGVLFTQGINEQQTISNILGESKLQDTVNRESYPFLQSYFQRYEKWRSSNASASDMKQLDMLRLVLTSIGNMANKRSLRMSKNTELLPSVADFCRALNGGRCTSCKSGKDRTAMSVTWEEARILNTKHGLPEGSKGIAMHAMRDAGVRRFNVVKNTGASWYAFNPFQHQMLPAVYRAPRSSRSSLMISGVQS